MSGFASPPPVSAAQLAELSQLAAFTMTQRRFTVQDGGSDPLLAYDTSRLPAWTFVGVSDLGGCGPNGTPGFGLAPWTGAEWRRVSRGVQAAMVPFFVQLQ